MALKLVRGNLILPCSGPKLAIVLILCVIDSVFKMKKVYPVELTMS